MVTLNTDFILKQWSRGFGIVIYLNEDLTNTEIKTLEGILQDDPDILKIRYISKDEAMKELEESLGSNAPILGQLDENPLPASFELKLKKDIPDPSFVEMKASEIKQIPGVEDVEYGEKWLSSLNTISQGMKVIAIFLGSAIFIAIIFITYSTIKILFYRRIDEVETLKLIGATRTFIRLPFLIEGLFIGLAGGFISSLILFGIDYFFTVKLIEFIPSIKAIIMDMPVQAYMVIPAIGAVMSFIGSVFATGRIRY
jgi:cell division transport system permease protein